MTSIRFLEFAILASFGMIALMLATTMGVKAFHALRHAWYKSYLNFLEPPLEKYVTTGELQPELERLRPWQRHRFLSTLMVQRIFLLKGTSKDDMMWLAVHLGLVEHYLDQLASRRRWQRARAAENLGFFGGPAVASAVSALLSDGDETVRAVAARALARIGTEEAVRALVRTLDAPSELTRLRVAENLDRIGSPSIAPLVEALASAAAGKSAEPHGAIMATRVLGNLRATQARTALLLAMSAHENDELRAEAAHALGLIGDPDDVPAILEASHDRVWIVRAQVAVALGTIGEISAIRRLKELVVDEDWWVRRNACSALANMGPKGEEALISLLQEDPEARDQVAATLEARGLIRRSVRNLSKPGMRGERAYDTVVALVEAGTTKHLEELVEILPEGEGRRLLDGLLGERASASMESLQSRANGVADELGSEGR